jgi:penicillin amidase
LGKLLDPVNGWAASAEAVNNDFTSSFSIEGLHKPVSVIIEDRLVPHIIASDDHDLYMVQGYVHAYFRLWQMDMQTRAAAGRVGEIIGEKWVKDPYTGERKDAILEFDRTQRRKGMVYAAENSLKAMEAEPRTKTMLDAYTAGINNYVASLNYRHLPLEYKLIGFVPEQWTNLKSALLLKYMADDLTGYTEDIPLSLLRDQLSKDEFDYLFPPRISGSTPVIPQGTKFTAGSLQVPASPGDSVWAQFPPGSYKAPIKISASNSRSQSSPIGGDTEDPSGIGSNSWAISGAHTTSGAPILCNDPHLGLNLPSLWFEIQLQAPGINSYGVSLPGAPGIIIGFNDSLSWGFTNNYRDVKDFYEIEGIDRDFYRFDGKPQSYQKRAEVIQIKSKPDFVDTVNYTVHGPVMYDESFPDPARTMRSLAMCWMAHRGTNELLSVYLLNRARNYIEFTEAILHFECPAQNIIYADRLGNIAMWGQGQFINKWTDQGRYVMKGNTSATLWGADIPMTENPNVLNPDQGYLASANQVTTDSTYPYWYNGYFYDLRAWRVNQVICDYFITSCGRYDSKGPASLDEMGAVQNETFSILAASTLPIMLTNVGIADKYTQGLGAWDFRLSADDPNASLFQMWWEMFYTQCWADLYMTTGNLLRPSVERTMQLLRSDTGRFKQALASSYKMALDSLSRFGQGNETAAWYKVKNTSLTHLAKIPAFGYKQLKIGGWGNTINAAKSTHGPSWRMVVEMRRDSIKAFGVYPGGQSGNPGSKYYGTFVDSWVEGKYYPILFLSNQDQQLAGSAKYKWTIQP